jgi:hypothetical protein
VGFRGGQGWRESLDVGAFRRLRDGGKEHGMARDEFDDTERWSLVRPSGMAGLVETVVRGLERWLSARAWAQVMASVAAAATEAGVRAEVIVVEGGDAYWTMTVAEPGMASRPAKAEALQE